MRYKYFLIALFLPLSIIAQYGGQNSFYFANVEHSPRIEALGGSAIAVFDNDVSLSQSTPSLLNTLMHNELVFTFGDYFSDISFLSFSYASNFKNIGVIGISIKAINYGEFMRNDAAGDNYGVFTAFDQVLTIGLGKKMNEKFSIGVNVNLLNAYYDRYTSFALSSNISSTYLDSEKKFTSTIVVKNIGRQLNSFSSENEALPYEIQFAIGRELAHLPFRYHLT